MKFTKMQATGNDFIVIDAPGIRREWSSLARAMCHRQLGVGADGLILVQLSKRADFRMRMFNPDGTEAEVCGNGLRCFGKYVLERGLVAGRELTVETLSGIKRLEARVKGGRVWRVRVNMGLPRFQPEEIPVRGELVSVPIVDYPLSLGGVRLFLNLVSMGNPHAVCFLKESVAEFPLAEVGPKVENHPLFPQRTNFEVATIMDRGHIAARVWERGAGETLSCGSGACAIAVAAHLHGYTDTEVDITLPGGILTLGWDGQGDVYLSGPAAEVFEGEWPE